MPFKYLLSKTLLAIAFLSAARSFCAEPDPVPKSFEEQVAYLEGALTESLHLRDFAMLEMAVKGFKAANLPQKDLELSMLRAERDAAWLNGQGMNAQSTPAALMETWGLTARAKLGDEGALAALRKMADDAGPAPDPLPAAGTIPAADFLKLKKLHDAYAAAAVKRGYALLALALMKEPGIQDKAFAAVQAKHSENDKPRGMNNFGGGTDPAVLAVLEADAQTGWNRLVALCSDERNNIKEQAAVLGELNHLVTGRNGSGSDEKFSVTNEIRQRLPKDAQTQIVAPFVGILKRYSPDAKQSWDGTLNYLSNVGMTLPANALPPDGVAALEALVNKLPGGRDQFPKLNFLTVMKRNGKDITNTPVKPPKPPQDAGTAPVKPPKPPDEKKL